MVTRMIRRLELRESWRAVAESRDTDSAVTWFEHHLVLALPVADGDLDIKIGFVSVLGITIIVVWISTNSTVMWGSTGSTSKARLDAPPLSHLHRRRM